MLGFTYHTIANGKQEPFTFHSKGAAVIYGKKLLENGRAQRIKIISINGKGQEQFVHAFVSKAAYQEDSQ